MSWGCPVSELERRENELLDIDDETEDEDLEAEYDEYEEEIYEEDDTIPEEIGAVGDEEPDILDMIFGAQLAKAIREREGAREMATMDKVR